MITPKDVLSTMWYGRVPINELKDALNTDKETVENKLGHLIEWGYIIPSQGGFEVTNEGQLYLKRL